MKWLHHEKITMKKFTAPLIRLLPVFGILSAGPALAGLVANPSFEENYNDTWPHYGGVNGWTGGSGTNRANGPFHNNGTPVTDGTQMAFAQGSGGLNQVISGLTVGQSYWIQFFYDARACCGGTINLETRWEGTLLDTISSVTPVTGGAGYKFKNVVFTPAAESGTLAFATTAAGDATALLDAVCIVPRSAGQVIVMNPSFEASGTPIEVVPVAGWTGEGAGSAGVNDSSGPFANNGAIPEQDHAGYMQGAIAVSQTLRGLVVGSNYTVGFRYNARTGNTPTLKISADGTQIFSQAVTPVGGVAAYRSGTATFKAAATTALLTFAQIAVGDQTVLLDDIKVSGATAEVIPNLKVGPTLLELGPGLQDVASFTVSGKRLAKGAAVVKLRIANAAVARLVGADGDGVVTLTFPAGAANGPDVTLTTKIEGTARGSSVVEVTDNGGHDGVDGSVRLECVTSFVRNASFETTAVIAGGVGYGPIMAWTAGDGTGLNNNTLPFFDNGLVPDRSQVAFLQGSRVLSQPVSGLTPGQRYVLQAYYNVRNCCGGTMNLKVRFAGVELAAVNGIEPAGAGAEFHFLSAPFVAAGTSGLLEFATTAAGDASLLLDGICIVPLNAGEIMVKNPSFEASGTHPGVGYLTAVAGWTVAGGHGVNVDQGGPFSDNGIAGAQDRVGFLQGRASYSQTVEGLTAGASYTLTYLVNARSGDSPGPAPYRVMIDGNEVLLEDQAAVGPGNPYDQKRISFIAAGTTTAISFEGTATDDQTLLLDDIHILSNSSNGAPVALSIALLAGNSVDLSWPASAPANLLLQQSTSLITGSWTTVGSIPFVQNGVNHVTEVISGTKRYYRLAKP